MTFITITNVRQASGAPVSLVSDATVTHAIEIVEGLTSRKMNTKFTPTKKIDILDGTSSGRFFTDKNPLLKVISLSSDGNSIDADSLEVYKSSGKVVLGVDSGSSIFIAKPRSIVCEYLYGLVEEDDSVSTTTSGAETAGTSVVIAVGDATSFTVGDWVFIYGTDGNEEVAQITVILNNDVTVDQLIFDHVSGSLFIKATIPQSIKRFMELEATIYVALNAIGATYTFSASYSIGDLQVTKGVPYTHWRESLEKAIKERNTLTHIIKPRFKILV